MVCQDWTSVVKDGFYQDWLLSLVPPVVMKNGCDEAWFSQISIQIPILARNDNSKFQIADIWVTASPTC